MEQPTHAYLGELEDVRHPYHSYFADGDIVTLPLIYLPDIVLFPGEELPLRILSDSNIESILSQLSNEGGLLAVLSPHQGEVAYGTTVRIEKFHLMSQCASVTGAAKQRFRLRHVRRDHERFHHTCTGEVEILPDIRSLRLPFAVSYLRMQETSMDSSLISTNESPKKNTKRRQRRQLLRACDQKFVSFWGRKVFVMYDAHRLIERIQQMLISSMHCNWFRKVSNTQEEGSDGSPLLQCLLQPSMQQDPSIFAYWIASNLPLTVNERLELLKINCIVRLLQKEISILETLKEDIHCSRCGNFLSNTDDIFSMTHQGAAGTFVNPGGHVFQIMTLREIHRDHVYIDVARNTQDSWFSGYSWSIAYCNDCYTHLGWQFDHVDTTLTPARFYGFRRAALTQSWTGGGAYEPMPDDETPSSLDERSESDGEERFLE